MFDSIQNYLLANWIEIVGAFLSLIYLYLSVNQKISLWIFGFLSSAFYIVIFFESKFYADMTLQFYYLVVSVYGLINWQRGKNQETKEDLPVTNVGKKQSLTLGLITMLIFAAYYIVLKHYTDSPVPIGDSFTTALCIVGTWMLARKMLENWLLFILADGICIGLFIYKELYPTAILFTIYTIVAIIGYFRWKRSM